MDNNKIMCTLLSAAHDLADKQEISLRDLELFCSVRFDEVDQLSNKEAARYLQIINKVNKAAQKKGVKILPDSERQKCEVWTRVMGYYRPVSEYNCGKKAEFYERRYYSESKTKTINTKGKENE